ncbi:MAG TPA: 50S ribosomal protein L22 [Candidatus Dormibacteraeota bacterium]|nr:50S ribosomal protein L22 [Candidatus Dormibacteraeota bacterium]
MEVVASAKWVRVTARKARLISHMVEGLPVGEALTVLRFTPRSAARDVAKVIKSAAANAEHNYNLDASTLRVARVEVDGAMIIKRWRAKPRGMVGSVFKRTSHLRAFVTDDELPAHTKRRSAVRMPRALTPTAVLSTPSTLAIPRKRKATAPPTGEEPEQEEAPQEESTPRRGLRRRRRGGDEESKESTE